jgi:hypothetical protein
MRRVLGKPDTRLKAFTRGLGIAARARFVTGSVNRPAHAGSLGAGGTPASITSGNWNSIVVGGSQTESLQA